MPSKLDLFATSMTNSKASPRNKHRFLFITSAALFLIALFVTIVDQTSQFFPQHKRPNFPSGLKLSSPNETASPLNDGESNDPVMYNLGARADFETLPSFCTDIIAEPMPYDDKRCHRKESEDACDASSPDKSLTGKHQMFSQFFQDHYLYWNHFRHLQRRGIYFDVATNHPVKISNTYFMDRCLRWAGVCVEGNPGYMHLILDKRSCQIVPTCVSDAENRKVNFILAGGNGGVKDETHKYIEAWKQEGREPQTMTLYCTTLRSIASHRGIKVVDYMSLDVEGAELKVLQGMDWDNVIVNVMTVEVSDKTENEIDRFLTSKGYVRHMPLDINGYPQGANWAKRGLIKEDAIFLHNSVEFGKPV